MEYAMVLNKFFIKECGKTYLFEKIIELRCVALLEKTCHWEQTFGFKSPLQHQCLPLCLVPVNQNVVFSYCSSAMHATMLPP